MTLKIEEGKFYRTRDGRKVGPMVPDRVDGADWMVKETRGPLWSPDGRRFQHDPDRDLIAEWTDEPEALDLTAITTPFGLLPPETQQALRDHGGPYQIYRGYAWEAGSNRADLWAKDAVFRVNPKAKIREGYAVTLFRSAREAKTAHPGCDPIFVREVTE